MSVRVIEFDIEAREAWREASPKNNTNLFGETVAGQYYESLGYRYVYKGFNIFGGNRPEKWPDTRELLLSYYGEERFKVAQQIGPMFENVIEPDLLVYKPDLSELFFVEVKRTDTGDKLHPKQARALVLIASLLDTRVEVAVLVPSGKEVTVRPEEWAFPLSST